MARQSDRQTSAKPGPCKPSDRRISRPGFVPLYVPFLFPPPALLLIVFRYYPRFSAIHHSFTIREIPQPGEFVGLQNYRALAGDPVFSKSVSNILKFMLGRTTLALVMAFIGVARACPWLGRPITSLLALICIGFPPPCRLRFSGHPGCIAESLQRGERCPAGRRAALDRPGSDHRHLPDAHLLIETMPQELFEAARLDGADELTLLARIAVPLAIPAFGTLAIAAANPGGEICGTISRTIAGNGSARARFVFGWHSPRWRDSGREPHINQYSLRYESAAAVGQDALRRFDSLLGAVLAWQRSICAADLPDWLRDGLVQARN